MSDVCLALIPIMARGPVGLSRLAVDFDYMNRRGLTFDDLSFGLARLVDADLVEPGRGDSELTLAPTHHALTLTPASQSMTDAFLELAERLGIDWREEPPPEDRSLGRFQGFSAEEFEAVLGGRVEKLRLWQERAGFKPPPQST
jgi:hypothetical protein